MISKEHLQVERDGKRRALRVEIDRNLEAVREIDSIEVVRSSKGNRSELLDTANKLNAINARIHENPRLVVVGAEKAGKSTFTNALLGAHFLPTDERRCSFVTVELVPSNEGEKNSLAIEFLSKEELEPLESEIASIDQGGPHSALAELRNHFPKILEHAGLGTLELSFDSTEELASEIKRYVADPEKALAIRKATVHAAIDEMPYTSIICDAPGINSGLSVHERNLAELVADSDAIILVKDIDRPTLEVSEQRLIQQAFSGANRLGSKVGQRVFVFLNKIDRAKNLEQAERVANYAKEELAKFGIDPSRIFCGSALLQLERYSSDAKQDIRSSGNRTPSPEAELLDVLPRNFGLGSFLELRKAVGQFLIDGRLEEAERSVRRLRTLICDHGRQAMRAIESVVGDRLRPSANAEQQSVRLFYQNSDKYFETKVDKPINDVFKAELTRLLELIKNPENYRKSVRETCEGLPDSVDLLGIVERYREPLRRLEEADIAVRAAFFGELTSRLRGLGKAIASEVAGAAIRMMNKVDELCWGDTGLRDELIRDESVFLANQEAAIESLLMRYARPVLESRISCSRDTSARSQSAEKWELPLKTIEMYTTEAIKDGKAMHLAKDNPSRKSVDTVKAGWFGSRQLQIASSDDSNAAEEIDPWNLGDGFESVSTALREDLDMTQQMLEFGVYAASGIEQHCEHVLRSLRQSVTHSSVRHLWTAAAVAARASGQFGAMIDRETSPEDEKFDRLANSYWIIDSFVQGHESSVSTEDAIHVSTEVEPELVA